MIEVRSAYFADLAISIFVTFRDIQKPYPDMLQ